MQNKTEIDQIKTVYYSRYGVTKKRGQCYTETKDNLTAFYSYNTIVGFMTSDGIVYMLKKRISNTTSKHVSQLRQFACGGSRLIKDTLPPEEFWKAMFHEGVIDCFRYRGTSCDPNPLGGTNKV